MIYFMIMKILRKNNRKKIYYWMIRRDSYRNTKTKLHRLKMIMRLESNLFRLANFILRIPVLESKAAKERDLK